jgi:hypothetical protein
MLKTDMGGRAVALVAGVAVIALGAVSVGSATSALSKATFVKVKCPGKTAQGKKVTCKVKGDLPVGPEGPAGAPGPPGPAGSDGVSGYETIRETFTDVFVPDGNPNRGLSAVQTVPCPAGKRAIGGGTDLGTNAGQGGAQRQITVSASAPTNAGDGWKVQLFNNSSFGLTIDVEVFAICARA